MHRSIGLDNALYMNIPLFAHDVSHGTVEVWKVQEGEEGPKEQLAHRVDKDCDYNMCDRGLCSNVRQRLRE